MQRGFIDNSIVPKTENPYQYLHPNIEVAGFR